MKIIVCGGRDYKDRDATARILTDIKERRGLFADFPEPVEVVIHGNARGLDRMAGIIAHQLGFKVKKYPAQWDKYENAAGPIRNRQMLEEEKPDAVVAFPGGAGTDNMVAQAVKYGVKVIHVAPF